MHWGVILRYCDNRKLISFLKTPFGMRSSCVLLFWQWCSDSIYSVTILPFDKTRNKQIHLENLSMLTQSDSLSLASAFLNDTYPPSEGWLPLKTPLQASCVNLFRTAVAGKMCTVWSFLFDVEEPDDVSIEGAGVCVCVDAHTSETFYFHDVLGPML